MGCPSFDLSIGLAVGADQEPGIPGQTRAPKLIRAKQLVWKTVPLMNENGTPQRAENPLGQYGITATQVLIGDPRPEDNLDRLLMDKKRLVAERIKTVQEQETSKAQARTEQVGDALCTDAPAAVGHALLTLTNRFHSDSDSRSPLTHLSF